MCSQPLRLQHVMSQKTARPLPLLLLLMITGVHSQWSVTYSREHICALKDSTVTIYCTYSYPHGHQIKTLFWTKTPYKKDDEEFPDLSEDPKYSGRIQYLGDKKKNCTMRLSHVTLEDSHMYYFRFTTDQEKWIGIPGVRLSITDLQLESPERVTEGDSVHLTCKSSCELTDTPTFIWTRNSQILTTANTGNKLILSPVRREDAGGYRCAVRGHTLTSPEVHINVMYPPEKPVISISGSSVIVEGDSVSLICSCDSNPPAEIHWFKGKTHLKSGQTYNISKISSSDSGEYKCKSINQHGEKYSDKVILDVKYPPRSVSVSVSGSSEIVEGDSVSLICSSDSNPPAEIHWFQENQNSSVGSGQSFSARQSGRFYCQAHNTHGSHTSDAVTVTVRSGAGWWVWLVIVLGCVGFIIVVIIVFMMKKRRATEEKDLTKQENLYSDVTERRVHVSESADPDAPYATVSSTAARNQEAEDVQYVTVHHQKTTPEDDCHYGNIRFQQPKADSRRFNVEEVSLIYSSVK